MTVPVEARAAALGAVLGLIFAPADTRIEGAIVGAALGLAVASPRKAKRVIEAELVR